MTIQFVLIKMCTTLQANHYRKLAPYLLNFNGIDDNYQN